jgi:hypothetical protein
VPSVSPSGGGGGVSAPLTLTAPNDLNPILTLVAAAGTIADGNNVFVVNDEHGLAELQLDPDRFALTAGLGAGAMQLDLGQTDAGGAGMTLRSDNGIAIDGGSITLTNAGANNAGIGIVADGPHAAPADNALAGGKWTLWFDQTNGASKLMVKAKSADGTVVTAAIALA